MGALDNPTARGCAYVVAVYVSYFVFYSAYKKPPGAKGLKVFEGGLSLKLLKNVFKLGSTFSNNEVNKVLALAGLTPQLQDCGTV